MKRGRHIPLITAALFAASGLATPALAGKADNTVIFVFDQTLQSADRYFNTQLIGNIVADQIWDSLIYRDPSTGVLKADLATAWRWIDDKTLELDLRQGVKFHNGADFSADDVVYTLNYVSRPQNRILNVEAVQWIDHVERLGTYKVRIIAKKPFPAAIAYLASPAIPIYPHDYYAKVGPKGMNERPVGTGPYRIVEHALGKHLRLERNALHFRDSPKAQAKIDKVEIRFIPDAQTRVAEVVTGGVDLISRVIPDQAEELRGVRTLKIVSVESNDYEYLQFNMMANTPAPQLRNIMVRQAVMYAIDRETIAKFVVSGGSRVLHVECHPADFGCIDDQAPHYAYDPAKARRLLAEAGYAKGFDLDLYAWRNRNAVEAIIGYLGAVGIRARIRYLQYPAWRDAVRGGRVALAATSWASSGTFDVSATVARFHEFSSEDLSRDPEIRDLFRRGDDSLDAAVREQSYAKALKLIAERAYVLPLYSLPTYYAANADLVFTPDNNNFLRFYEMSWK